MRSVVLIALLGLTVGCASNRQKSVAPAPVAQLTAPSAALAFDGPMTGALPEYALNRPGREGGAYVGYDETIVTWSYTRTDDRQYLFDDFNDYDRRAYSARVGVSYR